MFFGWSFEGDYQGSHPTLFIKLGTAMNECEAWGCLGPERSQTLIVLANYVDPRGIVFPGNRELARKLRISENAAQERISDLLNFRYTFDADGKMQESPDGKQLVVYCDEDGNPLAERQRDDQGRWKRRYLRILAPIRFGKDSANASGDSHGVVDNLPKAQLESTLPTDTLGSNRGNSRKAQLESTLRVAKVAEDSPEPEPLKPKPEPETRQNQTHESRPVESSVLVDNSSNEIAAASDNESETAIETLEHVASAFRLHVGREPLKAEVRLLLQLAQVHGLDALEKALFEYHAQKDLRPIQSPIRYVSGVLANWEREGVRQTNIFAHLERLAAVRGKA